MQAGDLRERIEFQSREDLADNYGNTKGDWKARYRVSANIRPRFGGEEVMAARLGGRQPVTITVRYSSGMTAVTTDFRVKDMRTGEFYNLRSIIDPTGKKQWIEMLAEKGVQT